MKVCQDSKNSINSGRPRQGSASEEEHNTSRRIHNEWSSSINLNVFAAETTAGNTVTVYPEGSFSTATIEKHFITLNSPSKRCAAAIAKKVGISSSVTVINEAFLRTVEAMMELPI